MLYDINCHFFLNFLTQGNFLNLWQSNQILKWHWRSKCIARDCTLNFSNADAPICSKWNHSFSCANLYRLKLLHINFRDNFFNQRESAGGRSMMRSVPKSKNCQHWILIDYYNRQRCSVENKKSGVIITIKTWLRQWLCYQFLILKLPICGLALLNNCCAQSKSCLLIRFLG
jgi:hypothetical protein